MDFLRSAISNYQGSRPKVKKVSFLVNNLVSIGLWIYLNHELGFLNLCTDHPILHQLYRKRFALRIENLHLLRVLRNVTEYMVSNKIKKMTNVTQRNDLLVQSSQKACNT
jgi:hypothetical protein